MRFTRNLCQGAARVSATAGRGRVLGDAPPSTSNRVPTWTAVRSADDISARRVHSSPARAAGALHAPAGRSRRHLEPVPVPDRAGLTGTFGEGARGDRGEPPSFGRRSIRTGRPPCRGNGRRARRRRGGPRRPDADGSRAAGFTGGLKRVCGKPAGDPPTVAAHSAPRP